MAELPGSYPAASAPATSGPLPSAPNAQQERMLSAATSSLSRLQPGLQHGQNLNGLLRILYCLPPEMRIMIINDMAATQPQKYGHIERADQIERSAVDLLGHLPPIDAGNGVTISPKHECIDLATEAIVKGAVIHITFDHLRFPLATGFEGHMKHIHRLNITIQLDYFFMFGEVDAITASPAVSLDHAKIRNAQQSLPLVKEHFPNLEALNVMVTGKSPESDDRWGREQVQIANEMADIMDSVEGAFRKSFSVGVEGKDAWMTSGRF